MAPGVSRARTLTPRGIQTGSGNRRHSISTPGQDTASAESRESLPTLTPNLPRLLISTDSRPALLQALQTPLGARPTPLRPAGCSGGPWAQPGVTYQSPAGTLRRHVAGNGAGETLREEEREGLRADSPRPAPHVPSRAHSGCPGGRESRPLGLEGRGSLRPTAQRHRGWGPAGGWAPRQTPSACLLFPPNSASRPGLWQGLNSRCVQGRVCVQLQSRPPCPGPAGSARGSGSR